MSVMTAKLAAEILFDASMTKRRIVCLPDSCKPLDLNAAYLCQNYLAEKILQAFGGKRVGYKIGCTNKSAQERVNMQEPFYGPLLSPLVHASPTSFKSDIFFMRIIEPEFSFQMAFDLPPRSSEYTREEVSEAVAALVPSIEIVDSRYEGWVGQGGLSLIADNACNGGWIYGKPYNNWRDLDLETHEVHLYVNGTLTRKGRGEAVLGNPLNALTWLANTLSKQGKGLKAGEFISTGIPCDVYAAEYGDQITADFGPVGAIELQFV